jgi:protein gp37/ParB-like chromosome segregation protein Spo0J
MAKLGPYEVHPFADKFPLIGGDEFGELVEDIRQHGQQELVVLNHDGSVLIDGRNRYRACEAAGVGPKFRRLGPEYTEVMILDFIVSENRRRRHLDAGQLAFLALDYKAAYADAAKAAQAAAARLTAERVSKLPNQGQNGTTLPADRREASRTPAATQPRRERESATRAAKVVGASGRSVQRAQAVQRDRPDLADKVRSGEIALDAADRQRRQWVRSQPKPEPVTPGPVPLILRTHDGQEFPYPQPKGKATFNQTPGEGISWAEWSWNPVTGCLHGCDYCYAREIATSDRLKPFYPAGFTPLFHHERLDAPRNTVVPAAHQDDPAWRRVFVCSMADLYGRWVPDEWIDQVHTSMLRSPQWQYILLTKFPARYVGLDLPLGAWLGTSVDEQKRVRIAENAFRELGGVAVKWLSLEPLREPLEFTDLSMFDWVVIGAQTETRQPGKVMPAFAPPFEWVARIVAQAREAGCRVHLKPNLLGAVNPQLPGMQMPDEYPEPSLPVQGTLALLPICDE